MSISHAPPGYVCPFCRIVARQFDGHVLTQPEDLVFSDAFVTGFIGAKGWRNNPGHVILIPNTHYENLYDLPVELGGKLHEAARNVALAMKAAYGCEGISTRQHNEPAGNQDVWHYHLHVFPRYEGDDLYGSRREDVPPEARAAYARQLRESLAELRL